MRSQKFLCAGVALALSFAFCPVSDARALQLPAGGNASTSTSLTASAGSAVEGQTVTLTATVTSSAGTPSGYVTFYANGSDALFSIQLNSSGVATLKGSSSGYPAGNYTLTAKYLGTTGFSSSTSSGVPFTLQSPVTVAAQAIPNPVVSGQKAELQATVTATDGGGTPTGSVSFYVGSTKLGSANLSSGSAVLSAPTTGYPTGTYPVVAKYNGDALHGTGSSSTVDVVLQPAGGVACGTGSESLLNGTYGFVLSGYDTTTEIPFKQAGAFVANGKGGVTGGEEDFNFFLSTEQSTISNLSVYSVGPDGRGCLTLVTNNEPTHTYRFSLISIGAEQSGVAGGGRMIEFDDSNGSGIRATGGMVEDDTSELNLADLASHFSFLLEGFTYDQGAYQEAALLGNFALANGAMSSGVTDLNLDGMVTSDEAFSSGTITSIDAYGRATMTVTVDDLTLHYAVYMINKGYGYLVSSDATGMVPVLSGELNEADDDFTSSNFPKTFVEHMSGRSSTGSGYDQRVALTSFSAGSYSSTIYEYANGSASSSTDSGTYAISANGRLVTTSSHGAPQRVFYLFYKAVAPAQGAYVLSLDATEPSAGGADAQVAQTYSNSVVAANYGYGHDLMLTSAIVAQSGEVTLNSSGALSGTLDLSGPSGLTPAAAVDLGKSFNFGSNGVSAGTGLVGITTGYNIYYILETGDSNPEVDLSINP